jgi:GDP-4-dehydro-6-deoxy-D-mannose reductase
LRPIGPYAVSKLAQEMVVGGNPDGPAAWIARPFNHIGPRQSDDFVASAFARQIAEIEAGLRPPQIAVGNLEARRDLADVRDTVRAYHLILESGVAGRPYNVCSERAVAVQDLLDTLLSKARVAIEVVRDPARYRPIDTPVVLGSATRLRQELGWRCQIPLEQTLDDLLTYWRHRLPS